MSALSLVLVALLTYASRAVSLVLLPRPNPRIEAVLARIPGPIFASLAAAMLLTDVRSFVTAPTLWAAGGALLASPARSLLGCLLGGAIGYAIGVLL